MNRYEITAEEHRRLLLACRPKAYLVANGIPPDQREDILAIWGEVAARVGCDRDSIRNVPGEVRAFLAEPLAGGARS